MKANFIRGVIVALSVGLIGLLSLAPKSYGQSNNTSSTSSSCPCNS